MQRGTAKKIAVGVLAFLTLALGVVAVLIGLNIVGEDPGDVPDDPVSGRTCCSGGECPDGSSFGPDCNFGGGSCDDRRAAACGGAGAISGSDSIDCNGSICENDGSDPTNCVPQIIGNTVKINDGCGRPQACVFTRRMTGPNDDCFANQSNADGQCRPRDTGFELTASPGPCFCQQVDINWNSRTYGTKAGNWQLQCDQKQCGQACQVNEQCPDNHLCSDGTCKLQQCINNPGQCTSNQCELLQDSQCGESCVQDSQCPNNHSCDAGTCKLDTCITNPANCTSNQCQVLSQSQCGESCTSDTQCPTDHSCDESTCKLNTCITNPASCTADQCDVLDSSQCGESCTSDTQCPTDHSCDGSTCKLDFCINNPADCSADQCEIQTDITIVKDSQILTCQEGQATLIDYEVQVNNLSNADQTIDSVVDTLDSRISPSQVTDISDGGTVSGNVITWPSFNLGANSSETFNYTVSLTASQSEQFANEGGLENVAVVNYGGNSSEFRLITPNTCIPDTGLFEEENRPLLLGLILILLGIMVNRFGGMFVNTFGGIELNPFGSSALGEYNHNSSEELDLRVEEDEDLKKASKSKPRKQSRSKFEDKLIEDMESKLDGNKD